MVEKLLLAAPRGFCAGVVRAIDIVERSLERYGLPLYVRKEIVHNPHVVAELRAKGVRFVQELDEVPDGARVVFSAHGVSPEVYRAAQRRGLQVIDATCPLVSKVHVEARRFAGNGYTILLIGHEGHEEVEGTMGEAPQQVRLITSREEAERVDVPDPNRVAYLTQTTLSVDDTREVVETLRQRFPNLAGPPSSDICYATQNRQDAVRTLAREADLVLVVGARNSSNSNRLVEVARKAGTPAWLIGDVGDIDPSWLEGRRVVGLSSGASAPERLVQAVCDYFRGLGATIEELVIREEKVEFALPRELR
ncbi:MAG: 4-hydroxy-3-methylbut-2-enyl diphosphate reductase [Acidobacteriota bacterium]